MQQTPAMLMSSCITHAASETRYGHSVSAKQPHADTQRSLAECCAMTNSPDQIVILTQAEQKVYSAVGKQVALPAYPLLRYASHLTHL